MTRYTAVLNCGSMGPIDLRREIDRELSRGLFTQAVRGRVTEKPQIAQMNAD